MAISLITLSRIPAFRPVREEMRDFLKANSAALARVLLREDAWEYEGHSEVALWLMDSPDADVKRNRMDCLELVIQEWESESSVEPTRK